MAPSMAAPFVDRLNFALIGLAALLALVWPFETLLLAYGVLGPLHYLTEISWLHDRRYFLPRRHDRAWLLLACVAVLVLVGATWLTRPGTVLIQAGWTGVLALLALSCTLVWLRAWRSRLLALAITWPACWWLCTQVAWGGVLAGYLPTLIHVYVFTGVFMAVGWWRRPNPTSAAALMGYLLLPLLCWSLPLQASATPSGWAREAYLSTLAHLGQKVLGHAGIALERDALLDHPLAVRVARVLAFAYLYHYLNWFSKVGVIGWGRISQRRGLVIATGWLFAVMVYAWDYGIGFVLLLTLSFLHVLLEFPLNGLALRQLLQRRPRGEATTAIVLPAAP